MEKRKPPNATDLFRLLRWFCCWFLDLLPVPHQFKGWSLWVHVMEKTSNILNLKRKKHVQSPCNHNANIFLYLDIKLLINTQCFYGSPHLLFKILLVEVFLQVRARVLFIKALLCHELPGQGLPLHVWVTAIWKKCFAFILIHVTHSQKQTLSVKL